MERPRPVPLASALPTTTLRVSHVAAGEGELERWQLEIGLPPELPGANPGTTNLVLTAFQSQDSGWKLLHVQGFPGYHASIALDAQAGPPLLDGRQVWRVHLAVFDPRIGSVNLNLDWIQGQNHVRGHVLPAR